MPRNSFLIEDILDKNDSSAKLGDQEMHPFKKRTFAAMNDSNEASPTILAASSRAKHFKHESQCLSPASSVDSDLTSQASYYGSALFYDQTPNDLVLNSLLQKFQHSFSNDPQLLANYYAVLAQFQDDFVLKRLKQQQASATTDYNQQLNQYIMSKLLQQQQQQSLIIKHANDNTHKAKPVKAIQNETKLLQKPKSNSMSSSPSSSSSSSSSSAEMYNSNSNNLSPQSTNDDCSSSCIENVSPLDALLQLANSTFINKQNSQSDACLMDQDQSNNFKKLLQQNGAFIEESIFLNNDLLLQQQQLHHQQQNLEKQQQQQLNKSSLNNSFESNTSSNANVASTKPSILITSVNANTKRKRKNRTAFTANQICELERRFANQKYLSPHDRDRIAYELQLSTAQVITWFQNRRAKQKRDIEEMKNDVNAAKSCKVLDPDLDVEKVLRLHKFNELDFNSSKLNGSTHAAASATTSNSDRNSINENEFDPNDDDITNTDYDDDNQSMSGSANGDSTSHDKSISENTK